MKSIKIFSQILTNTHEEIEVYKRLLTLCGVKFEETSPFLQQYSNSNVKLHDVPMNARTRNVLKRNITEFFYDITIEEFVSMYPRQVVARWRNIGKDSIIQLSRAIGEFGYAW